MKTHTFLQTLAGRSSRWIKCGMAALAAAATLLAAAGTASAKPVITHEPVHTAVKGEPLGLRATVRDAGGRVSAVSVFYASSRGMTPFRRDLSTTGAGIWFGSIPGHLIGPGSNLFYYVHADNLEGESTDTDWVSVRVIEPGMSAADMPTVEAVARKSQRAASPSTPASAPAKQSETSSSDHSKYWIPAAVIVGGAAAVGGAIAIANSSSGGGGGGSSHHGDASVTNANFGGSYSVCFEPSATNSATAVTVCDSGIANIYVKDGAVQVVGLWGGEVLTGTLSGSSFTAVGDVSARLDFPAAHLIVSGDVGGSSCSARVDGYSSDTTRPGNFTGNLSTTRR
jgi:hypothetical protein